MFVKQKRKSKWVKAKIIATIGPASTSDGVLARMIRNGMSVARF